MTKLALEQTVCALHFLFFAQLYAVADHPGPARLSVLARNEVALLDGTLFRKTPEAFQEEFHPFPSTQPANPFTMSCQFPSPSSVAFFFHSEKIGLQVGNPSSRFAAPNPKSLTAYLRLPARSSNNIRQDHRSGTRLSADIQDT